MIIKTSLRKCFCRTLLLSFLLIVTFPISKICGQEKTVVVIVSSDIYSQIETGLTTFINDLENEKYNVVLKNSSMSTPEEVRGYLQNLYNSVSPPLVGTILIGNIPYAYQFFTVTYTNPNIQPTSHNCISMQFYADLDGTFEKNNPSYPNSYSVHSGDIYPEIWVSVLPLYHNDLGITIGKVNEYLQKNHEYRAGIFKLQNGYVEVDEFKNDSTQTGYNNSMQELISGQYSWQPLTTWGNTAFYISNRLGLPTPLDAYNNALAEIKYKMAVLSAHGSPTNNGQLTTSKVKQIHINPVFIWLGGCNTGKLENVDNILTEIIYSNRSKALVGKGGTTEVGGLGNNVNGFYGHNIAEKLLEGKSFGEAILYHLQDSLVWPYSNSFEQHNAPNIFIGDLTLTLFPNGATSTENDKINSLPSEFILNQNYPNPFNPETVISYRLPTRSNVSLVVYDILGNEVAELVNKEQTAGIYAIEFDASKLSSGVYYYKLTAVDPSFLSGHIFVETKKMVLLK